MKPRIAVIITRSEIGGAQNYVLSLVSQLKQHYEFDVIVGSNGYLSQSIQAIGVNVFIVPQLNSANLPAAIVALRKLIKKRCPNLINTHSTLASIYARLAIIRLKIPLVYSVHGWFFSQNTSMIRRCVGPSIERALSGLTSFWITETHFDQAMGHQKGAIPDIGKSIVIPNGIPEPKDSAAIKLNRKYIQLVFVGRISYQKNPSLAIEVLNQLPQNFVLTMYCDDANDRDIVKLIEKHQLADRITLIDSEKETASVVHAFDLMLVTSRYEGMPLSIIEAMSAGLPIVCADVCGLEELIENSGNGYLVKGSNPADFATRILKVFNDPERARRMGERSNQLYLENHTIEKMAAAVADVFNRNLRA